MDLMFKRKQTYQNKSSSSNSWTNMQSSLKVFDETRAIDQSKSIRIAQVRLIKDKRPFLFSDHGGWRPDERASPPSVSTRRRNTDSWIWNNSLGLIFTHLFQLSLSKFSDFFRRCWKTRMIECNEYTCTKSEFVWCLKSRARPVASDEIVIKALQFSQNKKMSHFWKNYLSCHNFFHCKTIRAHSYFTNLFQH